MPLPENRPYDEVVVGIRVTDCAAVASHYGVAPIKGWIKRAYSVTEGTTNGAPVLTVDNNGTDLTETITIASGGGAGDVDSVDFTRNSKAYVNAGDPIGVSSDGAGSTTVAVNVYVVIEAG